MKRFIHAVLPAFMLAISVGQIYAFTNFSDAIATHISTGGAVVTKAQVQFAFSLGIFFLGMGAAFFGSFVEKNLRLSALIGASLFIAGMVMTGVGISSKSLAMVYLGYGGLVGVGTGIIYISPVKVMMLWFREHKALAAALPVVSFGLGSTLSTFLYKGVGLVGFKGFEVYGITKVFFALAMFYIVPMVLSAFLLRRPDTVTNALAQTSDDGFSYAKLLRDSFFKRSWLFMFLNICCGLCLIPLSKQLMKFPSVGYSEGIMTAIIAAAGLMNGGGRLVFAWWSDHLAKRINILLIILAISLSVGALSFVPMTIGLAILVINACYGAGFSVMPAILSDRYGIDNLSRILGAVLSAWGVAGLVGNQVAILVSDRFGFGYMGVITIIVVGYSVNVFNVLKLKKIAGN